DRIPGADRGAAVDCPKARSEIAFDENAVADRVAAPDPHAERTLEAGLRVIMADLERVKIGGDQLVIALEPLADQRLDGAKLNVEQRRKRADVNDVLIELALPRVGIFRGADLGQRHAQDLDVVAGQKMRDGPVRIVKEVAARL